MIDPKGSTWRKWDLHVHTPASLVHSYGDDAWDKFIDGLSKLPPDIKVLGINDYIFIDGYKKVLAAKNAGSLPNIEMVLPVIEVRLDKFGGSKSGLSRVNFHVIFSNDIPIETIESQFLNALTNKYNLIPEMNTLIQAGKWSGIPTIQSLTDLGNAIISSVPESEKDKFDSPLKEGFNNLCFNLEKIESLLESPYFKGKVLTAVGKTEWADIKWNDQSIADKKTIINRANLVFISAQNEATWRHARDALTAAQVNDRLLDCSDAHHFSSSNDKDRLGKCLTWIKSDPTFEGLRQAVFEFPSRIQVSESTPIDPPIQIKKVTIDFPTPTQISRGGTFDKFCFQGKHEIDFSPHLTCIIGGRGAGKSTLLNIIHEKLNPGTDFFRNNKLSPGNIGPETNVTIEGISENGVVEFLQQNEIEQFAMDHTRLTSAVFSRIRKHDSQNTLASKDFEISVVLGETEKQIDRAKTSFSLRSELKRSENELKTQKSLLDSIQNEDYTSTSQKLTELTKKLLRLQNDKARLKNLRSDLLSINSKHSMPDSRELTVYEDTIKKITDEVSRIARIDENSASIKSAEDQEIEIIHSVETLKQGQEAYLKQRGLSEENLSDVGMAAERASYLENEILSIRLQLANIEIDMEGYSSRPQFASEYKLIVEKLLEPINEALKSQSTEVKPIELQYNVNRDLFDQAMIQYIAGSLGNVDGRSPRLDYIESRLKNLDLTSLTTLENAVAQIEDDGSAHSKALRGFLSEESNFVLLKLQTDLELLNIKSLGQIHILYDGKPIANSSFGQRCTAVIVVLLLLGNNPIVIDEPEAHLDSSLIAKYLVDLIKKRKIHRQIIFSTHNANFVVNGDAELIHCLSIGTDGTTSITSTTIENLDNRESLLSLEGGPEAFLHREKRYGIQ